MNRIKFISAWLLIFGVLAAFTVASIGKLSGIGAKKAYAATIQSDNTLKKANSLIAVTGSEPGFNGNEVLCSVDNSQYQLLHDQFGATINQVNVAGTVTNFVSLPKQKGLNQHELKDLLGGVHCHVILQNNLFYILFRGDVS